MYIKIKHIKKLLLISACVFFAGFNYLTYVKADSVTEGVKTCDKAIDNDCDGLINTEEALYGTDANNTDSDGDGYSDGVEIKSGYDPMKAAPGDRIIKPNKGISNGADTYSPVELTNTSLTREFAQELKTYADSKDGQAITKTDIQSFIDNNFAQKIGSRLIWDTLPKIDSGQIKILQQQYSSLSKSERDDALQRDAAIYLTKISYLLASNLPTVITSNSELHSFALDFQSHLVSLSTPNPDIAYFSDLGNRLEFFSNQLKDVEVPETMLGLHIKFLKLIGGVLTLREAQSPLQDPMAQSILINRVQDLTSLSADFFGNDFQNYIDQFKSIKYKN